MKGRRRVSLRRGQQSEGLSDRAVHQGRIVPGALCRKPRADCCPRSPSTERDSDLPRASPSSVERRDRVTRDRDPERREREGYSARPRAQGKQVRQQGQQKKELRELPGQERVRPAGRERGGSPRCHWAKGRWNSTGTRARLRGWIPPQSSLVWREVWLPRSLLGGDLRSGRGLTARKIVGVLRPLSLKRVPPMKRVDQAKCECKGRNPRDGGPPPATKDWEPVGLPLVFARGYGGDRGGTGFVEFLDRLHLPRSPRLVSRELLHAPLVGAEGFEGRTVRGRGGGGVRRLVRGREAGSGHERILGPRSQAPTASGRLRASVRPSST